MSALCRIIGTSALAATCCAWLSPAASAQNPPPKDRPRLVAQIGHTAWVDCLAFSADGKLLATSSDDYTVRLWETATGRQLLQLQDQESRILSLAISPDSRWLLTVADTVRLWNAQSGQLA